MSKKYKVPFKLLLIGIIGLQFSCAQKTERVYEYFKASNENYTYSGRFDKVNDSTQALISSAASVVFNTQSDSITLVLGATGDSINYVVIEIDGRYHSRLQVVRDSVNHISIALAPNQKSRIGVFKASEASNGPLLFYGADSKNIEHADITATATIEFIGDSITCGFGADTEAIPCGTAEWYDEHNAYLAYGPIAARAVNAGYTLSAVSGMGIYRNWNDEDTAPVMPDVYPTTYLDGNDAKPWNFSRNTPEVVSICLGTNDLSDGDGTKERKPFDPEKFTTGYIELVTQVFKNYPETKLALLTSPMLSGDKNELLLNCLKKVKSTFENEHTVAIFEFEAMQPSGCGGHPDLKDHTVMAAQLVPFYADLLGS